MKRFLFLVSMLPLLFLLGCATTNGQYSEMDDGTEVVTYASGVKFTAYTYNPANRLPDVYFDVTFTKVDYSPVTKSITLHFYVQDAQYENASYFAVLQEQGKPQTITLAHLSPFPSSVTFSLSDLSLKYRIVLGKVDSDNLNPTYSYVNGSAWIDWTDTKGARRNTISTGMMQDTTAEKTLDYTGSEVSYSLSVTDQKHCIDTFIVELYDNRDNLVETKEVSASSVHSESGIQLRGTFEGLAPDARYSIRVLAEGDDGADDFSGVFLSELDVRSAPYGSSWVSDEINNFDGLFVVLYDIQYGETGAVLSYYYQNDHTVTYMRTDEEVEIHLEVGNREDFVDFALEPGDHQLTIPPEMLSPSLLFAFTDQKNTHLFYRYQLPTLRPTGVVKYDQGKNYHIELWDDFGNILSVEVVVKVRGFTAPIETILLPDVYTQPNFTIYHEWDSTLTVDIAAKVTYSAYGKEYVTYLSLPF